MIDLEIADGVASITINAPATRNALNNELAWEALPSEQVEERAAELARRAARDPQLARKATVSLRTELGPPRLPWAAALEVERGAQLWSLRRRVSQ
jgi:enoyl-CoA hydratase